MKKLELKDIVGYLPYGLKAKKISKGNFLCDPDVIEIYTIEINYVNDLFKKRYHVVSCKPILRPLSDLTDEHYTEIGYRIIKRPERNRKYDLFSKEDGIAWINGGMKPTMNLEACKDVIDYLLSIHADVHGLIEAGLAIDINTLPK